MSPMVHPTASPGWSFTAGDRIGPYVVKGPLGQGAMGVVLEAHHRESGDPVAIKTVMLAEERHLNGIRREIHALRRLRHPGIVRIVDDGSVDGRPWYAMDLLRGWTLGDFRVDSTVSSGAFDLSRSASSIYGSSGFLSTEPDGDSLDAVLGASRSRGTGATALPDPHMITGVMEALRMIRSLCAPLAYLHGHGIVHRDLKPANIFIRHDRGAIVVDFGLSSHFGGQGREKLETAGDARGTPAYMAPEQLRGQRLDARADLYSLGCILYRLVTGHPPYSGKLPADIIRQHLHGTPIPPRERGALIDEALEKLILRLLEKDRRARLGHADDVDAALAAAGVPAPPAAGGDAAPPYLYRPTLVEREGPTATLHQAVVDVTRSIGSRILISGESGAGKTALASAATTSALSLGVTIVTAECAAVLGSPSPGRGGPLQAFRPLLELALDRAIQGGRARADRLLGARGHVLMPHLPALAATPGLDRYEAPPELPPEAALVRLIDAVVETTLALAEDRPLLLVIDDLQWADELSLAALKRLDAGELANARLLVVGTFRSDEVSPELRVLANASKQIIVPRLGRAGIGRMVSDMLALGEAPALLVDFLWLSTVPVDLTMDGTRLRVRTET